MRIEVVASSSAGNCYIIKGARDVLLIEAGIPITAIKKALNFDFSNLVGCLVSHCHMDHAKAVKDLLKLNIGVYSSVGTFEAMGITNTAYARTLHAKAPSPIAIGEFKVRPFEVEHDAPGSYGFMVRSDELKQTIVFATDTFYLKYKFVNVHCYMVEANYSKDILAENVEAGRLHPKLAERTMKSHFEINDVVEFLKATDTTKTKKIMLLHPSAGNADTKQFESMVMDAVGIEAITAVPGLTVEI